MYSIAYWLIVIVDRKRRKWLSKRPSSSVAISCWHMLATLPRSFTLWKKWRSSKSSWASCKARLQLKRQLKWLRGRWPLEPTGLENPWPDKMRPKNYSNKKGNYSLSWSKKRTNCRGYRTKGTLSVLFCSAITEHPHSIRVRTTMCSFKGSTISHRI